MDDKQTNAKLEQGGPCSAQRISICSSEETVMSYGAQTIIEGHQTILKSKIFSRTHPIIPKKSEEPASAFFALKGAVVDDFLLQNAEVLRKVVKSETVQINHFNLTVTKEESKSEVLSVTSAGKKNKIVSDTVEHLHEEIQSGTVQRKQSRFTSHLQGHKFESSHLSEIEMAFAAPFNTIQEKKQSVECTSLSSLKASLANGTSLDSAELQEKIKPGLVHTGNSKPKCHLKDESASPSLTAAILAAEDSLKNTGKEKKPEPGPEYVNQSHFLKNQEDDECARWSSLSATEAGKYSGIPSSIAEVNHMNEGKKSVAVHDKQSYFTKLKSESLPSPEAEITCRKSTNIEEVVHEERKPGAVHKKQTNFMHSLKEQDCLSLSLPTTEIVCGVSPSITGIVKQNIKLDIVNEYHASLTRKLKEHESSSSSSTAAEIASRTSCCIVEEKKEEMNLDAGREKQVNLREKEQASLSCIARTVSSDTTAGAIEVIKLDPVHRKHMNSSKKFIKQKRSCLELNQHRNSLIKKDDVHCNMTVLKQINSVLVCSLFKQFEAMIDKSKDIEKLKTKNGDIYMLIPLQRTLKSGVLSAPVTFVVDLKSIFSDALERTDFDTVWNCNDVWVIDYVLKQLQR